MSRTDHKPMNKKAILCEDCGKWVTLQGYGGHRRFYHGEYQKYLKRQLFNRLMALGRAGKIPKDALYDEMAHILASFSDATMDDILEVRDFIAAIP